MPSPTPPLLTTPDSVALYGQSLGDVPVWQPNRFYQQDFLVQQSGVLYARITAGESAATWGADQAHWTAESAGSSVTSFNNRSGAVTLSKADVTATGLTAADVGAIAVGGVSKADVTGTGVTWSDLAAAQGFTPTAVKTAAYTAAAGEFVPVDASAATVTITLPTAPADKTRIGVKAITAPGANAVTIAAGGSDVFNLTAGATTLTLSAQFQGVQLQYKASTGIWYVSTADTPLNVASGAAKLGTDGKVGGTGGSALAAAAALVPANNLSDLANAATARTSLGLGSAATHASTDFPLAANNLSDLASAATARTNLGLGSAALGTSGVQVVAADKAGVNSGNTGTTLQSITDLAVAIGASATEIWLLKWWILNTATNNVMDIKFGLSVPSGCTARWGPISTQVGGWENIVSTNSAAAAILTESQTSALGGGNLQNGNNLVAVIFGGGTAGNVTLQYAQNTADAGNLVLNKGSIVEYLKVQS